MQSSAADMKERFLLETQMRALEAELASSDGGRYVHYEDWNLLDSLRSNVLRNDAALTHRISLLAPDAQAALAEYAQRISIVENGSVDIDEI